MIGASSVLPLSDFHSAYDPQKAANENALARGPWTLDGARLHFREQFLIDPFRGAAQRKFAQRRQVGGREEMLECALGLLGNVDFSFLETLNEIVGGQIDQFDGIGAIEYRVGHRLADADMRDLRDHVVEAFDVLDVDGGVNVDAVTHQLFDVEVAFRMAAAFGVGMGEFVDQSDLRTASYDGVEIELLEPLAFILDAASRNDFKAL